MTIIVTGGFTASADTRERLLAAAVAHSRRSRDEDGCLEHHIHEDAETPGRFFFYERWRDMDALRAHFRVPESAELVAALRRDAVSVEEIAIYEAVPIRP